MNYAVIDQSGTLRVAPTLEQLPDPRNHEWIISDTLLFENQDQLEDWRQDYA